VNTRGTTGAAQQQQGSISQASAAGECSTPIFFIYIYIYIYIYIPKVGHLMK